MTIDDWIVLCKQRLGIDPGETHEKGNGTDVALDDWIVPCEQRLGIDP